jgi:hypothetical protein
MKSEVIKGALLYLSKSLIVVAQLNKNKTQADDSK